MKVNLGVIFGSRSCECEVSIISAIQMMKNADSEKYNVVPIFISQKGQWYTGDCLKELSTFQPFREDKEGLIPVYLDMTFGSGTLLYYSKRKGLFSKPEQIALEHIDVFVPVLHGLNGEDGTIQGILELAGVPYTSAGVVGSAVGMDKLIMKTTFTGCGFPVLPWIGVTRRQFIDDERSVIDNIHKNFEFPVFVKPANQGSSIGVSRADSDQELNEALMLAFEYDRRAIVEKGLDKPLEFNCSVIGYDGDITASPVEMPITSQNFLDFGEKYLSSGGTKGMAGLHRILPAPIDDSLRDRIQSLSRDVFSALDCKGVIRVDFMLDKTDESLFITEVNTIPGSLAFYLWDNAGVSYRELIDRMVNWALQAHEDKTRDLYAYTSDILSHAAAGAVKGGKGSKSFFK